MKRVVDVKSKNNAAGTDVWVLTLQCGHQVRVRKKAGKPAPVRLKCRQCESETAARNYQ